jgi:hypothetical protein
MLLHKNGKTTIASEIDLIAGNHINHVLHGDVGGTPSLGNPNLRFPTTLFLAQFDGTDVKHGPYDRRFDIPTVSSRELT